VRLGRMEHDVVEAEVAVHDARRHCHRQVPGQPVDQRIGGLDAFGLAGSRRR
jgi:hypothetical protein